MRNLLIPATMCTLFAVSGLAHAGDYAIDMNRSQLYVQVYKDPDTLGAGLSHNHVMQAAGWSGNVSYDPANPSACQISITVPVQQLIVDEPSMRSAVGYSTMLEDGQREDVRTNMLASSQLNASAHPNITFQSTSCTDTTIAGNLTIRGVTKAVTMNGAVSADDASFTANGTVDIRATQFGFQPYSALLGQLKNRDDMKLTIRLVANP